MSFDELRLVVGPGDGFAARWPGVVLLLCGPRPAGPATDRLFNACEAAGATSQSGRSLIRVIASAILAADDCESTAFALVARCAEGVAAMAHGDAGVAVTGDGESVHLAGWEAATWVDRVIAGDARTISLSSRGGPEVPESEYLNLKSGVVPAISARLGPNSPYCVPTGSIESCSVNMVGCGDVAGARRSGPEFSPAGRPFAPAGVHPEHPGYERLLVDGLAVAAAPLAAPLGAATEAAPSSSPTQSAGVLIVAGGAEFPLERDLVIGRDPWDDEQVRAGTATAVVLDDPERSVSRVHAMLRVVGQQVVLVDCGSTNGTSIAGPGASGWTAMSSRSSVILEPGTRVLLGQCTALYETAVDRNRLS